MENTASVQRTSLISDPPGLTFTDLKPGDSVDATVTVTNDAPYPVELSSQVTRDGVLFQGAHPLAVSFEVSADRSGVCVGVEDALPAHSTATVHVTAVFPAEAGNEYQLQSGSATLFLTATELTGEQCEVGVVGRPPGDGGAAPWLPHTGIDVSGVVLLAVALLAVGFIVRSVLRRRDARLDHGRTDG